MAKLRIPVAQKTNKIEVSKKAYDRKKEKNVSLEDINSITELGHLIMDDSFACSFQTMSQYREELLRVCKEQKCVFEPIKKLIEKDSCFKKFKNMSAYRTALIRALFDA